MTIPQIGTGLRHHKITVGELLSEAGKRFAAGGVETPALDARILMAEALAIAPGQVIGCRGTIADGDVSAVFQSMVVRRLAGEPVYRILGRREFYGREFRLTKDCLIPRPETELLVERVLEDVGPGAAGRFADIGCGSGAICVSLLAERPKLEALATDLAQGALDATVENAERHGVGGRLQTAQTSYLEGVDRPLSFIVSNPPYIAAGEMNGLAREVREHDPPLALDGGPDGLAAYREILSQARQCLAPGGRLYLETGQGQHGAIIQLAEELRWGMVSTHLDLSGLERILVLENTESLKILTD